jgi:hypothetical protein
MAAIGEATSAEWRVLLMLRFIEGIRPACVRDCGDASYLDSLIKDLGGPTQ